MDESNLKHGDDEIKNASRYCRTSESHLNLLDLSFTSRTEIHDPSNNNEVVAARTTNFSLLHGPKTRTDFSVKVDDATVKHFEEFPTPFSSLNPKKANVTGPMFEYDPSTDRRGKAINKISSEQQLAHDALFALRSKFTPKVILGLPKCDRIS